MRKKNRMCRPTIVRSYCRYYCCYFYRVMTVVTIVVTTIVMTAATDFFSHLQMPDVGHQFFKKNRIYFAHRVCFYGQVEVLGAQREFSFGTETCKLKEQFSFVPRTLLLVHRSVVFKIF